jgi:hypothetical protein
LREKILNNAKAKQIKGVNLNSRMFFAMLKRYIDALNQGSPADISSAWGGIVDNECQEAYDQSVELYQIALTQFFLNDNKPKNVEDVYNILKNIRDSTLEKYNKITASIERNDLVNEFKSQLRDFIDGKEQEALNTNEHLSAQHNDALLDTIAKPIKSKLQKGDYKIENTRQFLNDFTDFLNNYEKESVGFSKNHTLVKYLNSFHPDTVGSIIDMVKKTGGNQQLNERLDALSQQNRQYEEQLKRAREEKVTAEDNVKKLRGDLERSNQDQIQKLEKQKRDLDAARSKDLQVKDDELNQLKKTKEQLQHELEEEKRKKKGCCNVF